MKEDQAAKYRELMEEVKRRMRSIDALTTYPSSVLYPAIMVESVYLQFRKIVELIALASLVVNKTEYEKARKKLTEWRAKRLLDGIRKVNPRYYPQPVLQQPSTDPGIKTHFVDRAKDYLTEDQFVEL